MSSFVLFWDAFNYKKDKAAAADSWLAIPTLTDALVFEICEAAQKEARARPEKIAKGLTPIYAQGWLSGRRWEDEISEPETTQSQKNNEFTLESLEEMMN